LYPFFVKAVTNVIHLDGTLGSGIRQVLYIRGFEAAVIHDIRIAASTFDGVVEPEGVQHAGSIGLHNVTFDPAKTVRGANSVPAHRYPMSPSVTLPTPSFRTASAKRWAAIALVFVVTLPLSAAVKWNDISKQSADWYRTPEAALVGDAVLSYQTESGGWPKNWEMTQPISEAFRKLKETERAPTLDNGATTTQIRFLAKLAAAQREPRFRVGAERGIDYLLRAQYPNGGWPQFFPLRSGYYTHITFNDDAMILTLEVLRDAAAGQENFFWLDKGRQANAREAVERGIQCILRCQIVTEGVKTAWCAQHDETTLAPTSARKFEPASLAGGESVGILRFLIAIPDPSPEVKAAVIAGVAWFERVKLTGIRWERIDAPALPKGQDIVVVRDPSAPPLWARFYEIGTNRPIFVGRDAVIRYDVAEIEHERRIGFSWYVTTARTLLEREYPRWAKKWKAASK